MSQTTITRKAEVLAVLKAGGYIEQIDRLYYLMDASGNLVPAWQQAITANLAACRKDAGRWLL